MITVYRPTETNFNHNGLGVLMPTEATVTEELNGAYELQLTCTTTGNNKKWQYLVEGYTILAPTPNGKQPFRIYKTGKKLDNTITAYARHIFYDGIYNNIENNISGILTADAAIKAFYSNLNYTTPFIVSADISNSAEFENIFNMNPVNAILGDNGLIALCGGEILRDGFYITLKSSIGTYRGFNIRYRKNLTGLDYETDISNTVTRAKPEATEAEGEPLYLPEKYIESPYVNRYSFPLFSVIQYSDIKVGDGYNTNDEAYAEMRNRIAAFFASGGDLPAVNAKVDFVSLRDTADYKEYAPLEEIFLGDTVNVYYEELEIELKAKCISYTYDAILERYIQIELGQLRDNLASDVGQINRTVSSINTAAINVQGQLDILTENLRLLKENFESHTHKQNSADITKKISYNDLKDLPS